MGVAEEVEIRNPGRSLGGSRDYRAGPFPVRRAGGGVVPASDGGKHEGHRALRECGRAVGDPPDGTAHLVHVDLALRARRGEMDLAEPFDELVVETREV